MNRLLPLLAALALVVAHGLSAQTSNPRSLSPKLIESLDKINEASGKDDWNTVLTILNTLKPLAKPGSFDEVFLWQYEAQALHSMERSAEAVAPLSKLVESSFIENEQKQRFCVFISYISYQSGNLAEAERWVRRSFDLHWNVSEDILYYLASLLLQQTKTAEAYEACWKGLTWSENPKTDFYIVAASSLQDLKRTDEAVAMIEQLVTKRPEEESFWLQLLSIYLGREDYFGALNTMQRARARNFFQKPDMQLRYIQLFYNLEQYAETARLLTQSLADGTVENTPANWDLLFFSYRLLKDNDGARRALIEKSKHHESCENYLTLSQMFWSDSLLDEALVYIDKAIALCTGGRPHLIKAGILVQQKKYDAALGPLDQAAKLGSETERVDAERTRAVVERYIRREAEARQQQQNAAQR